MGTKSKSKRLKRSTSTSKAPPLFSEFGRRAKDLLTTGYCSSQRFRFSINSDVGGGLNITSTATKHGDHSTAAVAGSYKYKNATFNSRLDTDSKIIGTFTLSKKFLSSAKTTASISFPDLKSGKIIGTFTLSKRFLSSTKTTTASISFPDHKSGKFQFQTVQEYGAVSLSVALKDSPAFNFSAAVGSSSFALGMEVEYRTAAASFSKCTAGISMKTLNSDASIILGNKGGLLTASYLHYLSDKKKKAAVVEFTQNLLTKRNSLTVGGWCDVGDQTVVKARLDAHGEIKTAYNIPLDLSHAWLSPANSTPRALGKIPKIGLALSLAL